MIGLHVYPLQNWYSSVHETLRSIRNNGALKTGEKTLNQQ